MAVFCAALKRRWRASGRDLARVAREVRVSKSQLYAILNGEPRGLTTVFAGAVMFALLPLPPCSDPSLHFNTLAETKEVFAQTTATWCDDAGICTHDGTQGGRFTLNYSVGGDGQRSTVEGYVSSKVTRLAMRAAPGAPMHFVPIMDIGDGQRVFSFSGSNLYYAQFLAYDANGRLIENPPRVLWK